VARPSSKLVSGRLVTTVPVMARKLLPVPLSRSMAAVKMLLAVAAVVEVRTI